MKNFSALYLICILSAWGSLAVASDGCEPLLDQYPTKMRFENCSITKPSPSQGQILFFEAERTTKPGQLEWVMTSSDGLEFSFIFERSTDGTPSASELKCSDNSLYVVNRKGAEVWTGVMSFSPKTTVIKLSNPNHTFALNATCGPAKR